MEKAKNKQDDTKILHPDAIIFKEWFPESPQARAIDEQRDPAYRIIEKNMSYHSKKHKAFVDFSELAENIMDEDSKYKKAIDQTKIVPLPEEVDFKVPLFSSYNEAEGVENESVSDFVAKARGFVDFPERSVLSPYSDYSNRYPMSVDSNYLYPGSHTSMKEEFPFQEEKLFDSNKSLSSYDYMQLGKGNTAPGFTARDFIATENMERKPAPVLELLSNGKRVAPSLKLRAFAEQKQKENIEKKEKQDEEWIPLIMKKKTGGIQRDDPLAFLGDIIEEDVKRVQKELEKKRQEVEAANKEEDAELENILLGDSDEEEDRAFLEELTRKKDEMRLPSYNKLDVDRVVAEGGSTRDVKNEFHKYLLGDEIEIQDDMAYWEKEHTATEGIPAGEEFVKKLTAAYGEDPPEEVCNEAIISYVRSEHLRDSMHVFKHMKDHGKTPSEDAYYAIVEAFYSNFDIVSGDYFRNETLLAYPNSNPPTMDIALEKPEPQE